MAGLFRLRPSRIPGGSGPSAGRCRPDERGPTGFSAVVAFAVLAAVAVLGRAWQPTWRGEPLANVTPLAAVALAAGTVFPNPVVAAAVPVAALAVSNLGRPGYGSVAMAVTVYAAIAWPALLGGFLRRASARGRLAGAAALAGGSLSSSLVFFLSTNFACWVLAHDSYPHTASGLAACLAAGLPFYRWMPVGDLVWTGLVFGGMALAARLRVALTSAETARQ